MLSLAFTAAMFGIEGYVVRVEADSSPGTPGLAIIGLPDRALTDAKERVRFAIFNSGFRYPSGRLLVNLSPADIRKEGPAFDLPIALALLAIDEQVDRLALGEFIALGELALDGLLRPVAGILPMVLGARNAGFTKLIVPLPNADEAALVDGIELYVCETLRDAVSTVLGHGAQFRRRTKAPPLDEAGEIVHGDMADVRGQSGGEVNARPGADRSKRLRVSTRNDASIPPIRPARDTVPSSAPSIIAITQPRVFRKSAGTKASASFKEAAVFP